MVLNLDHESKESNICCEQVIFASFASVIDLIVSLSLVTYLHFSAQFKNTGCDGLTQLEELLLMCLQPFLNPNFLNYVCLWFFWSAVIHFKTDAFPKLDKCLTYTFKFVHRLIFLSFQLRLTHI